MSYVVFYSTNCKYSTQFLSTLQKTGEEPFFKKVCVDYREGRDFAVSKYNIKKVPTIIVNDQVIDGVNALQWLQGKAKAKTTSSVGTRHNIEAYTPPSTKNVKNNAKNHDSKNVIGGYAPELLCNSVLGSAEFAISSHAHANPRDNAMTIFTPSEDSEIQKSSFILPSDSITNGTQIDGKRQNKSTKFESDYEKLKNARGQ